MGTNIHKHLKTWHLHSNREGDAALVVRLRGHDKVPRLSRRVAKIARGAEGGACRRRGLPQRQIIRDCRRLDVVEHDDLDPVVWG